MITFTGRFAWGLAALTTLCFGCTHFPIEVHVVDDGTGQPVRGATVTLRYGHYANPFVPILMNSEGTTGANGTAVLRAVENVHRPADIDVWAMGYKLETIHAPHRFENDPARKGNKKVVRREVHLKPTIIPATEPRPKPTE